MKKLILLPFVALNFLVYSQLTYVNNFDGVYPFTQSSASYNLDLNGDAQFDCMLVFGSWSGSCFNDTNIGPSAKSQGYLNSFGQNLVNGNGQNSLGIDCTNDTLNILDTWNTK